METCWSLCRVNAPASDSRMQKNTSLIDPSVNMEGSCELIINKKNKKKREEDENNVSETLK